MLKSILPAGFNAVDVVSLSKLPSLVLWGVAVALFAAVVIGFLATDGAPVKVRAGLLALRVALACAVMALLLEPGLRLMATSREANRIVVAVDTSGSMAEDEAGTTRIKRAAQAADEIVKDVL